MSLATPTAPAGKVLVIDDNPIIQRTLYFALRDRGYSAQICGDIATALKLVRESPFDAILLDLHFPPDATINTTMTHDGFWALGWLRRMAEVKNTPIIVISGDPPEQSKAQAMAAGATAYIQKPVDKALLGETLVSLVGPKDPVTSS